MVSVVVVDVFASEYTEAPSCTKSIIPVPCLYVFTQLLPGHAASSVRLFLILTTVTTAALGLVVKRWYGRHVSSGGGSQ